MFAGTMMVSQLDCSLYLHRLVLLPAPEFHQLACCEAPQPDGCDREGHFTCAAWAPDDSAVTLEFSVNGEHAGLGSDLVVEVGIF